MTEILNLPDDLIFRPGFEGHKTQENTTWLSARARILCPVDAYRVVFVPNGERHYARLTWDSNPELFTSEFLFFRPRWLCWEEEDESMTAAANDALILNPEAPTIALASLFDHKPKPSKYHFLAEGPAYAFALDWDTRECFHLWPSLAHGAERVMRWAMQSCIQGDIEDRYGTQHLRVPRKTYYATRKRVLFKAKENHKSWDPLFCPERLSYL